MRYNVSVIRQKGQARLQAPERSDGGQAALIALLVLTIATTVGLSLISRNTTDIANTRNVEESARAFSAAEAGVENALRTGADVVGPLDAALHTSYAATVSAVTADSSHPLVFPGKTPDGNTETIWLTTHTNGTIDDGAPVYTASTLDLCWSQETPVPAVVATVLYKRVSDNSYQVAKGAFDPVDSRRPGNNFSDVTAATGGCGTTPATTYRQTINFRSFVPAINGTDVLIALRVRPVYNGTLFAVKPAMALPRQGNQVESIGKTESGVTRKISVYQQYRSPTTVFDAAVYSQGSFLHSQ